MEDIYSFVKLRRPVVEREIAEARRALQAWERELEALDCIPPTHPMDGAAEPDSTGEAVGTIRSLIMLALALGDANSAEITRYVSARRPANAKSVTGILSKMRRKKDVELSGDGTWKLVREERA